MTLSRLLSNIKLKRWKMEFGSYDDVELAGLVAEEARRKYHGEFFTLRSN